MAKFALHPQACVDAATVMHAEVSSSPTARARVAAVKEAFADDPAQMQAELERAFETSKAEGLTHTHAAQISFCPYKPRQVWKVIKYLWRNRG